MRYLLFACVLTMFISCSDDETNEPNTPGSELELWDGPTLDFTKAAGADPTLETNQDRITSDVWITRGNEGGQIFNIASEESATKESSPAGTRWAVGNLDDAANLTFSTFRTAVENPREAVGKNLVMYLETEDVYLSVKITSWDMEKTGGFSYERSTEK
ncbi:MAG: hypothetical protein AAGA77_03650 [Bacteroidota bacterium]